MTTGELRDGWNSRSGQGYGYSAGTFDISGTFHDTRAELDDAYENLLASRETSIIPGSLDGKTFTEEDILCNTNLQTETLFRSLNNKYKEKSKVIESYSDNIQALQEAAVKIESSLQIIKDTCNLHYTDGIEIIQGKYGSMPSDIRNANISIIKAIQEKKHSLEMETEDIARKLNILRKLILTGVNEIVKADDSQKKMCPVCFDSEVCMAYVPCGHTYCKGCSELERTRKCPQCRAPINAKVKIYFTV